MTKTIGKKVQKGNTMTMIEFNLGFVSKHMLCITRRIVLCSLAFVLLMYVHASTELVWNINIGIQHSVAFNFRLFPTKNKYVCTFSRFKFMLCTMRRHNQPLQQTKHHFEYVEFHTFPMSLLKHFNILRDVNQTQLSIYCLSPCGMAMQRIDLNLSSDWNLFLLCAVFSNMHNTLIFSYNLAEQCDSENAQTKPKKTLAMCIALNDTSKWTHLYSVQLCQIFLLHNTQSRNNKNESTLQFISFTWSE